MLRPTKHSHPDRTVISVSLWMLRRLKACRIDSFESLREFTVEKTGSDILLLPALNFLFVMGLIEYRSKTDAVEYISQQ